MRFTRTVLCAIKIKHLEFLTFALLKLRVSIIFPSISIFYYEKENNRIKRFILEIKEVGILIENHLILRSIRPSYTIHRLQRFDALVYRIISR